MTNAILRGKPDAGNPHVRFDEGEVASAKPRRGSLLYKNLILFFTIVALHGFANASEYADAYRYFSDERNSQCKITGLINMGKIPEAITEWNAMIARLKAHSRDRQILLANNVSRDVVLNVFHARWETNKLSGTHITVHDALHTPGIIDGCRKWHFERYRIPDELRVAYFSQDNSNDDNPRAILFPFMPANLNLDGSPPNGTVSYVTGGFIGKNYQTDGRRTEIASHLWQNRTHYLDYFQNASAARRYFEGVYMGMDNPALYLKLLPFYELRLKDHVNVYGKIPSRECDELLPQGRRDFTEASSQFSATITRVIDGDTIVVAPFSGGNELVIRLERIDAPETGQPFGKEAKEYLSSWIGSRVNVYGSAMDKYGRMLGSVVVRQTGLYLNLRLVSDGFAWHYKEYDCTPEFAEAETFARKYRLNLWSDPGAIKPSEWRNKNVLTDSDNARIFGM